jgi:hypothetical protein
MNWRRTLLDGALGHLAAVAARLAEGTDEGGERAGRDAAQRGRVTQPLEGVERVAVVVAGILAPPGYVLRLEQLAELLPRHAGGFLVQPVVQLVLQFRPLHLGKPAVVRPGGLALALAGDRIMPLQYAVVAVLELLDPDRNAVRMIVRHAILRCKGCVSRPGGTRHVPPGRIHCRQEAGPP